MARGKKPTAAEVVRWLLDNEHYCGARVPGGLSLAGAKAHIVIPEELCGAGLFRPSPAEKMKLYMFEPTEAGLALLSGGVSA